MSNYSSVYGLFLYYNYFNCRSCSNFLLVRLRISGVFKLLGVGVAPEYPGVAPPIIGVRSSQRCGV